jgi:hypothetical protein
MNILLYVNKENAAGKKLAEELVGSIDRKNLEKYDVLADLLSRLNLPRNGLAIAVLIISTKDELHQLTTLRDLFLEISIIIILPDRTLEMKNRAFQLFPRFISYYDADKTDIVSVLKKMMSNITKREGYLDELTDD